MGCIHFLDLTNFIHYASFISVHLEWLSSSRMLQQVPLERGCLAPHLLFTVFLAYVWARRTNWRRNAVYGMGRNHCCANKFTKTCVEVNQCDSLVVFALIHWPWIPWKFPIYISQLISSVRSSFECGICACFDSRAWHDWSHFVDSGGQRIGLFDEGNNLFAVKMSGIESKWNYIRW